jgi:ribonuclease Z
MRVILLGTGFPLPDPRRRGPSQLVQAGGANLLVDCGSGVVHQLVQAGVSPRDIHDVFLTHHHSDHTIDLGHLVITRWIVGQNRPLRVWGPRGTREYVTHLERLHAYDWHVRHEHQPSRPLPAIVAADIDEGPVLETDGVRVSAFLVEHYPVEPAFGFRIDGFGRAIAISGDTRPSRNLIERCRDVDVLVHECTEVTKLPLNTGGGFPTRQVQVERLASYHTLPAQVGKVATAAGARTLVLSHLTPYSDPDELRTTVAADYTGRLIVGEDLMVVT